MEGAANTCSSGLWGAAGPPLPQCLVKDNTLTAYSPQHTGYSPVPGTHHSRCRCHRGRGRCRLQSRGWWCCCCRGLRGRGSRWGSLRVPLGELYTVCRHSATSRASGKWQWGVAHLCQILLGLVLLARRPAQQNLEYISPADCMVCTISWESPRWATMAEWLRRLPAKQISSEATVQMVEHLAGRVSGVEVTAVANPSFGLKAVLSQLTSLHARNSTISSHT